jgi:type II secretory pathway predicted ATPase ExeA
MTGSAEGDAQLEAESARTEATKLTRLLCEACKRLDNYDADMSRELSAWWTAHKEIDERRRKKEQEEREKKIMLKNALKKLTKAERDLLSPYRKR